MNVVWLFLTVPRVCLQFVIVVLPDHTHLLSMDVTLNTRILELVHESIDGPSMYVCMYVHTYVCACMRVCMFCNTPPPPSIEVDLAGLPPPPPPY